MSTVLNDLDYILFFFVCVLLVNLLAGTKATVYFLVLVLLGQLTFNASKIKALTVKS
jgi:hypothetical protein